MSVRPTTPFRLAEHVLTFAVRDQEWRDGIVGDLREEYARMAARVGASRARRWHLRQSAGIAFRHGVDRLMRRPSRPRAVFHFIDTDPGASRFSGLTRDFRHAWRSIWQRPALSAAIVLTLGLALAANATIFSLMDTIVLRPFRFDGIDRLFAIASQLPSEPLIDRETVNRAGYRDWTRDVQSAKGLAAFEWWEANLSGVENPEQLPGFRVTASFFDVLRVRPVIGRNFMASEEVQGNHRRAILGHDLWQRRFASDRAIVGRMIRLNSEPYEAVGIAPPGFNIPLGSQVWSPISYEEPDWQNRLDTGFTVIGRLADGRSLDSARAEIAAVVERQRRDFPQTNSKREVTVTTFAAGMNDPGAGPFLGTWQAAAGLLLLIACANIANLLLARGGERTQEFAIRLALSSTRSRLFTQTIIEGLMLSLSAIAVAIPLAWIGLGLSRRSIPPEVIRFVPGWLFIRLDWRVLTFTAVLSVVAMLIFSLEPALQAMRSQVGEALRQAGRTLTPGRARHWTRNALATAQIALALGVLFGSGLMISAANNAVNGALGFDKENVLIAQMNLPPRSYENVEKRRQFINGVLEKMRAIPATTEVGFANYIPYSGSNDGRRLWTEEQAGLREDEVRVVNYRRIHGDYLEAMRIPLQAGRRFTEADREGGLAVALVSQGLADEYWPNQDPIGRRFKVQADGDWITVVGVVGNIVHNWFQPGRDRSVYRPMLQQPPLRAVFAVRTVGDPMSLAGDLRRAVAAGDPDLPIAVLNSLSSEMDIRVAGLDFIANSLGVVALIALVLAIMGIYSLMAYVTSQRTQEIGVRMALGAGGWEVIRLTTRQALRIIVGGTIVGAALSAALGRVMQTVLFGAVSVQWWQLGVVVAVLAGAAMSAAYIPARRASSIDPMSALRET